MVKKCIYCSVELSSEKLIDFCDRCGVAAFGVKTYKAILENMQQASDRGDLDQNTGSFP